MPEEAFKLRFSEKFLNDKETFNEIAMIFLNLYMEKIIIHNASFDLSFLNGELKAINKELIDTSLVIDLLEVARNKFPVHLILLTRYVKNLTLIFQKE